MNPCHRCKKTVYPVDKLSCLDKQWHKGCFNCEVCSMTLSMKTYKGYHKLPYCNTHYPTTKFTAVADTPENLRIKKNTENQSAIEYHKQFQQVKGKVISVTDDPLSLRIKKSQLQASDLEYQNKKPKPQVFTKHERKDKKVTSKEAPQTKAPEPPEPITETETKSEIEPEEVHEEEGENGVKNEQEIEATRVVVEDKGGPRYTAIFTYSAADDEEVSFREGDTIINGERIDAGWMMGTVLHTGATGMLPSNYVEQERAY